MADLTIRARFVDQTRRGFAALRQRLSGVGGGLSRITSLAGSAQLALVGMAAAAIGGLAVLIRRTINLAENLDKMSLRTGVSTEALSQMAFVAEQSGTNIDTFEKSLFRLQDTIQDARDGLETARRSFQAIGVSVEQLEGLDANQQFVVVADALNRLTDAGMRSALAMDIFGRAGRQVLPIIELGSQGIREMREEADRLGRTISEQTADQAAELVDALNELKSAFQGVIIQVTEELLPSLIDFTRFAQTSLIPAFRGIIEVAKEVANAPAFQALRHTISGVVRLLEFVGDKADEERERQRRINEERLENDEKFFQDTITGHREAVEARIVLAREEKQRLLRVDETFYADSLDLLDKAIAARQLAEQNHQDELRRIIEEGAGRRILIHTDYASARIQLNNQLVQAGLLPAGFEQDPTAVATLGTALIRDLLGRSPAEYQTAGQTFLNELKALIREPVVLELVNRSEYFDLLDSRTNRTIRARLGRDCN